TPPVVSVAPSVSVVTTPGQAFNVAMTFSDPQNPAASGVAEIQATRDIFNTQGQRISSTPLLPQTPVAPPQQSAQKTFNETATIDGIYAYTGADADAAGNVNQVTGTAQVVVSLAAPIVTIIPK